MAISATCWVAPATSPVWPPIMRRDSRETARRRPGRQARASTGGAAEAVRRASSSSPMPAASTAAVAMVASLGRPTAADLPSGLALGSSPDAARAPPTRDTRRTAIERQRRDRRRPSGRRAPPAERDAQDQRKHERRRRHRCRCGCRVMISSLRATVCPAAEAVGRVGQAVLVERPGREHEHGDGEGGRHQSRAGRATSATPSAGAPTAADDRRRRGQHRGRLRVKSGAAWGSASPGKRRYGQARIEAQALRDLARARRQRGRRRRAEACSLRMASRLFALPAWRWCYSRPPIPNP